MRESTLKRFMRLPDFEEHLELHRLDCSSSHSMLDNYQFIQAKQAEFGTGADAPPPLLTGKDLIAAGYKPGPWFSQVLSAVEDAQLEGRIESKETALGSLRHLCARELRNQHPSERASGLNPELFNINSDYGALLEINQQLGSPEQIACTPAHQRLVTGEQHAIGSAIDRTNLLPDILRIDFRIECL